MHSIRFQEQRSLNASSFKNKNRDIVRNYAQLAPTLNKIEMPSHEGFFKLINEIFSATSLQIQLNLKKLKNQQQDQTIFFQLLAKSYVRVCFQINSKK